METVKVPTTPHDLTVCFLDCVNLGASRFGVSVEDLLYETDIIRFSNTIGTNTVIQRDGSKIGLLISPGRQNLVPTDTDNRASPLVWPDMVAEIGGEVTQMGEVIQPPNKQAVLAAGQKLIDQGARCLVVALSNSEFNPANERSVREAIKSEYPCDFLGSVPVFLSSDISRRSGEAERLNAAVLNAYIHAKLVRLLYKAGEDLRKRLYRKSLLIVHNNGAVARVAKTRAINTYNSGPAAGLLGARLIGQLYGVDDLISLDMGGTSFDTGYVRHGQASYTLSPSVEGLTVNVPMLAIRAIGAGGGSIASVKDGRLQVGPQSAGALPGPVAFDLGGTEPTVTDADLILGVLDPDYFLGGSMKLNLEKAKKIMIEKVAKPLGVSIEEAASSIKETVDESMGREVRKLRDGLGANIAPLLIVYGGAGPAHCCDIARVAGLKKIVITPFSAVFSAFSSSSMDVGHLYYRRLDLLVAKETDLKGLARPQAELRREVERDMRGEGFEPDQLTLMLELLVQPSDGGAEVKLAAHLDFFEDPTRAKALITSAREALSISSNRKPFVLTTLGVMASAPVPHYRITSTGKSVESADGAKKGSRILFSAASQKNQEIAVYDRSRLQYGHVVSGPAVIESEHTTLLVIPGWEFTIDQYNNAVLEEVQEP